MRARMNILITGASGFVGSALLATLKSDHRTAGGHLRAAFRRVPVAVDEHVQHISTGDLSRNTDWRNAVRDIDVVVHCAARVHVMNDTAADPLATFRQINVEGTLNLARQAQEAGVKRFIFISSIKVNGEATQPGQAFRADDVPAPQDPYGVSKMEAEQQLLRLCQGSTMQTTIIRPVLVYGPGVKANFLNMIRWMDKGILLPLGGIRHNRRSVVSLDNLTDLICTCITHPAAANQVFLVRDPEDLSTSELLERTAFALGKQARLLPVPATWLSGIAATLGKHGIAQRLCGSLQVDIGKNQELLGWKPPFKLDASLKKTVDAYRR